MLGIEAVVSVVVAVVVVAVVAVVAEAVEPWWAAAGVGEAQEMAVVRAVLLGAVPQLSPAVGVQRHSFSSWPSTLAFVASISLL